MILIVVPILALAIAAIIITASPRYTVMQQKIDQLHNGIGETITNERVIKSFVREEHEKENFSRINQELVEKSTAALRMMILMQPVSTLAINVTTLAVVWFARKQTMVGTMELGTLTAFITYLSPDGTEFSCKHCSAGYACSCLEPAYHRSSAGNH